MPNLEPNNCQVDSIFQSKEKYSDDISAKIPTSEITENTEG